MTNRKCPKCGCKSFQIDDEYTVYYILQVRDGVVMSDGEDKDNGRHIRTTCTCEKCAYQWHPRNVKFGTFAIDKDYDGE